MTKLNQIIAVEKGIKAQALRAHTDTHRDVQRNALLTGISRTYQPKDEDGEMLPPEQTRVQLSAEDALRESAKTLTRLFDVVATKDWANCEATADVKVDGFTVLTGAPVTYLLFLEKQLNDLHTFVTKLPVLDPAEKWTWDENANAYRSEPARTVRTKKVPRNHVLAPATDKHPAQVQVFTEDIPIGYWTTTKFSGALPASRVNELAERVSRLAQAVKFAREEANNTEVIDRRVGEAIFEWLLAA